MLSDVKFRKVVRPFLRCCCPGDGVGKRGPPVRHNGLSVSPPH